VKPGIGEAPGATRRVRSAIAFSTRLAPAPTAWISSGSDFGSAAVQ
jgi:hypothetical protein